MELVCDECWCESDDEARGWVAFLAEDPEGVEPLLLERLELCSLELAAFRAAVAASPQLRVRGV